MANFNIRLMGPMRYLIGMTDLCVSAKEGATLFEVLKQMEKEHGESVRGKILAPSGDFHPYVLASINDADIRGLNGIDTRLNDGDKILIALQITGG